MWFYVLVAGPITAFFAFVALNNVRLLYLDLRASRWPSAEGVITRSEEGVLYDEGHPVRCWVVEYEYEVAGRVYRSTRPSFGEDAWRGSASVDAHITLHPVGSRVRVFHAPRRPGLAVLAYGDRGTMYGLIAVGALGAAGFIVLTLVAF